MPRPTKSPQGKAVRLTAYVTPETARLLSELAVATRQTTGEVISNLVAASVYIGNDIRANLEQRKIAPEPSDARASLPSLAGQPGVEHRAAAGTASPAAVRTEGVTIIACQPNDCVVTPFYDHPGWKLSATGQNVCIRCGKTKMRSKNASCKAPA